MIKFTEKRSNGKDSGCGKPHGQGFNSSCGAVSTEGVGESWHYRCDLQPDHREKNHHACGSGWYVEFTEAKPVLTETAA